MKSGTRLQGGYATRSRYIVQLLFTTFLHRYLDSQVSRPIDGNKRRFPRGPTSRISSLEPELFTVDSSRRPSRAARARARAPRARGACNFSNNKFQINSGVSPPYPYYCTGQPIPHEKKNFLSCGPETRRKRSVCSRVSKRAIERVPY